MYAIIRTGGKQAKVRQGDVIDVERIKSENGEITFTPLLIVAEDGTVVSSRDALEAATVTAEIVGEAKGPKIDIFKYKNKTGYRRRQGHRQKYTTIKVTAINGPAASSKKKAKKAAEAEPVEPEVTEAAVTDSGESGEES